MATTASMWLSMLPMAAYAQATSSYGPSIPEKTARAMLPSFLLAEPLGGAAQAQVSVLLFLAARAIFWALVLNGLLKASTGLLAIFETFDFRYADGVVGALHFLSFWVLACAYLPVKYLLSPSLASCLLVGLSTVIAVAATGRCTSDQGCPGINMNGTGGWLPIVGAVLCAAAFAYVQHGGVGAQTTVARLRSYASTTYAQAPRVSAEDVRAVGDRLQPVVERAQRAYEADLDRRRKEAALKRKAGGRVAPVVDRDDDDDDDSPAPPSSPAPSTEEGSGEEQEAEEANDPSPPPSPPPPSPPRRRSGRLRSRR